ncbi:hypothetical protein [Paragemmobacter straminiformis]|uniref:Uncharacterized protein n=1 Tax=Paragemmobacter straminiformis TaxID=2045119 RepID=A0A842I672_9RHOB|nr:hypothetical protein [Gemmobacter straminiformis]MBC2835159.1 hypothetical protein [Gemmobacter straminiformis]
MFHDLNLSMNSSSAFADLQLYLSDHFDAFAHAAGLLGGRAGQQRTVALIRDLGEASELSRRLTRELQFLKELLTLEHVGNPDRPESDFFAAINPDAPYVTEICLLSEGLVERIDAIETKCEAIPVRSGVVAHASNEV